MPAAALRAAAAEGQCRPVSRLMEGASIWYLEKGRACEIHHFATYFRASTFVCPECDMLQKLPLFGPSLA